MVQETLKAATIIDHMEYVRAIDFSMFINKIGFKTIQEYEKWLIKMYVDQKMSSREIQETHDVNGYKISVRQIQRYIKKLGIARTGADAFRLEVSKGNVEFHKGVSKKRAVQKSDENIW